MIFDTQSRYTYNPFVQDQIDSTIEQSPSDSKDTEKREDLLESVYSWADAEIILLLRTLCSHAKNIGHLSTLVDNAMSHIQTLGKLRKEFRAMRELWRAQRHHIDALDEVDMAIMRIQLRHPGEQVDDNEKHYKLHSWEVGPLKSNLLAQLNAAESQLARRKGQLLYLKRLQQVEDKYEKSIEDEICPVCRTVVQRECTIFQCGHITVCFDLFPPNNSVNAS